MFGALAVACGEVLGEQGDIFGAAAERRYMDGHAPQPEAEIAPVEVHAHHVVEIPVGCGDEAEIAFHFAHFADGTEAAQLQRPQERALHGEGQFAHFVKEQCAVVGGGEKTLARPVGSGERAPGVSEQMRLHQRFWQGGTVHGDERAGRPQAVGVQGAGEQFLAGPGFPGDEYVDVARGGFPQCFQRFGQRGAFPDDVGMPQQAAGLAVPAVSPLHGLRERLREIADAERFDQILPRPGAQGRLGGVGVAMPRNDDHIRTARKL